MVLKYFELYIKWTVNGNALKILTTLPRKTLSPATSAEQLQRQGTIRFLKVLEKYCWHELVNQKGSHQAYV